MADLVTRQSSWVWKPKTGYKSNQTETLLKFIFDEYSTLLLLQLKTNQDSTFT